MLSAIDGRATLADVAQKVGKAFDQTFQQLIIKLDKDGFIREVSAGTAAPAGAAAKPTPAKPAAKAAAPADPASDLDFSMLGGPSKPAPAAPKAAPARPAAPPPQPAAPPPPPKEQESALFKARQDAEAKAQAERERARKEAEDTVRAETAAKLRAEAEAKARAEAEAKIAAEAEAKMKAAREAAVKAAAEAKAKAEAEAKRAREEAERAKQEAEEKAERARKEAEERERKAREEAERARKEAEERERKEAEERERKAREEAERKALEAERRKLEEEKRREDEEREARRRAREEEEEAREEAEREARRKAREEEEAREAAEREARRKAREDEEAQEEAREAEERSAKKAKKKPAKEEEPVPAPKATAAGGGFADSLMADLDSFNTHEEEEAKAKEEAERKAREERERRAREEAERREKEEAERRAKEEKQRAKEEKERKKREEEERLRGEEEEEKERIRAEEERRRKEAEERAAKAKEDEALARKATSSAAGGYESEDKRRKRQLEAGPRDPSLMQRRQRNWGKPVAATLFLILVVALGVAHVMPVGTADYERAASEALGRPVRIGSARLWLATGLQLRLENVSAGDVKIERVIAHPSIASLTEPRKVFSAIELERITVPQEAIGQVLFSRAAADNFSVARVLVRGLQLSGPLAMPKDLQAELSLDANGAVRLATLRGPDGLVGRLEPQGGNFEFSLDAGIFTLPFAPEISFSQFGMKGSGNAQGLQIKQWDAQALNGTLTGTARVRWGGTWTVDGVITARGINAAVFAPALLSEGRGEGTGKFAMSGVEPGKLASGARLDGNFTVNKGVLGSFDLSRAIQTGGKQAQGRTQFTEMNGQVSYDRGEVELRNVTIGAGALNAGASAVISPKGALSGRIVADVRTASQVLRATLLLGGTVKEPQVRN
ncbi:MAG: hypothetical protein ACT4P3_00255 [Betaproteobacteria bacterium]